MKFCAHRINTIEELKNIDTKYGIEIDLRDHNNDIYLQHDPYVKDTATKFSDLLKHYNHNFIILNIKSERIEHKVLEILKEYNVTDYFFLDSSFPMIYLLSKNGENNIAMRFSEFESLESIKTMIHMIKWVWVDCFTTFPLTKEIYDYFKENNINICIVSPELQGYDPEKILEYKQYMLDNDINPDMICCKTYNIYKWYDYNIVLHHQGWGDLITCHGLVRYNSNIFKSLILITREDSKELSDYMYKDINNLYIDYIPKNILDKSILSYISNKYGKQRNILAYGDTFSFNKRKKRCLISWAHDFYEGFGIDYMERVNSFHIERNLLLEEEIYNDIVNKNGKNYIVIHDDPSRNININRNKINTDLPIFNLNAYSNKIFDMIKVLENAKEIHLIESTYSIAIYLLQKKYNMFENIPIYFHTYVRNNRNMNIYIKPQFKYTIL